MSELDIHDASPFAEPTSHRAVHVAILAMIALSVLMVGAGRTALTDPDEGRYALIAMNMVDSGNWLDPHITDGEPYFEKPPLYFWLTALSIKAFGSDNISFSARLVPAIGAVLTIVGTYLVASALFTHILGMISAAALLTTVALLFAGKFVRMDIYMVAFMTFAMWAFINGYRSPKQRRWFILMYVAIALGILTKGPVALVLVGAIVVVFLLVQRRLDVFWQMRLILGVAIVVLIAGPWFFYMVTQFSGTGEHDGFAYIFFVAENIKRITGGGGNDRIGSMATFPATLIIGMLPWTGVTILACARYFKTAWRRGGGDWESRLLMIWALVVFVFFSLARDKATHYMLPAFVPLAILTGRYMFDYWESDFPKRTRQRTLQWAYPTATANAFLIVLMLTISAVLAVVVHFSVRWSDMPPLLGTGFWGNWGWLVSVFYRLIAAAVLVRLFLVLLRNRSLEYTAWTIAAATIFIAVDLSYTELPKIADVCSSRRLVPTIMKVTRGEDPILPILAGPDERRSLALYLAPRRAVRQLDSVDQFSDEYGQYKGRMIYLLGSDRAYEQLQLQMQQAGRVAVLHQFGQTRLVLIRPAQPDNQNENTQPPIVPPMSAPVIISP